MTSLLLRSRRLPGAFGTTRWTLVATALAAAALASAAGPASAASAVTFVSGLGRDTGACTRAAPCRTFRYALTQTSAGGVLAALDRAGYGPVSITQSVSIIGPGKGGAAVAANDQPGTNTGIDIEASGGTIVLRGLQIDGGFNGINIGQAASVVISDSVIVGSSNLAINASDTSASVLVQDTTVQNAGVDTNAASFVAKRVTVSGSPGSGIRSLAGHAVLDDCTISGSVNANVASFGGTTIVKHAVLASASQRGFSGETNGTTYFDRTTTFGNSVGVDTVGPTFSYGTNNFPDGTGGTITPIAGD